jgi:gliding motility-associated-like protein
MRLSLSLFFVLFGFSVRATHIVGGELYYDCLGGNSYRITLKIYRDCGPGSEAPYDNPANISVFGPSNQLILNLALPFPGASNVPFVATNPCFQAPPNVCVQEAVYQITTTLPVSPSGFLTLAYQRCCRNNTILNIVAPQNTGSTYTETIPGSNDIVCNSSPRFTNFPPIALCVGDSLVFDHSATDPDGDSLVYQLCSTFAGATPTDPMPVPTSNPPFSPILFSAPFTPTAPMSSNPPININSVTGLLKVNPTQQGQFVVGVCALEYRNGQLIGTHRRDFQFNVTVCQTNVQSEFQLPQNLITNELGEVISCGNYEMNFTNQSINGSYYFWDFGVPGITTDVSNQTNPVYTYADTGTYDIMLVANPGYFCADTAFQTLVIKPLINVGINTPDPQCLDGNNFTFQGSGNFGPGAQFDWNFGASASPPDATTQNVAAVQFNTWGTFPVTFTVTDNQCVETASTEVLVYGPLTGSWELSEGAGCLPVTIQFTYTGQNTNLPVSYLWNFGDGSTSTETSPTHTYQQLGSFDVSLTITDLTGCNADEFILQPDAVTTYPVPVANFDFNPKEVSIFFANINYTDLSTGSTSCFYDFGDGVTSTFCDGSHEYMDGGNYPIMQVVSNEYGCADTLVQIVRILPEYNLFIPNAFTPNDDDWNEFWEIKGIGVSEYRLLVYTRWGERIFETNTFRHFWNGRKYNQGPLVKQDVYAYQILVRDVFGREHEYFGHVLLMK